MTTVQTMTTDEWLDSFAGIDDQYKAAEAALDSLGKQSQWVRTVLYPILVEALVIHRRQITRGVERQTPIGTVYAGETTIDQRRKRLEATFPLGDGRRVTWSEATRSEHEERIAYLERHIAGTRRTIDEHLAAIDLIDQHGVTCLADIEKEEVAA